jgi:hypothetical protein
MTNSNAQPKIFYRYTISDQLGDYTAYPLGELDFTINWERETDDGKRDYKRTFDGTITFTGDSFVRLSKFEKSIYRCVFQSILIQRRCVDSNFKESWVDFFSARISLNTGDWDYDRCQVSLKFEEDTTGQCLDDNKSEEINLFSYIDQASRKTVCLQDSTVTIEKVSYDTTVSSGTNTSPYWGGSGTAEAGQWVYYYNSVTQDTLTLYDKTTKWARQVMVVACTDMPPGGDWVLVEDTCSTGGSKKYAKGITKTNCTYTTTGNYLYQCDILEDGSTNTVSYDNGLPFDRVMSAFLSAFCSAEGLTLKSDFFQWNPDITTTVNYVTLSASKVLHLILFQKSDIKKGDADSNATVANWTFEKATKAIKYIFNVDWRITGGYLRLEHVDWWSRAEGKDVTGDEYKKYTDGKNKYNYETQEIPRQEVWSFMESSNGSDFAGLPIVYTDCTTSKSEIKTYAIEDITTDISLIVKNSSNNSDVVSNDGFCLVACTYDSGTGRYSVITEDGILESASYNNSLAISQLLRDYHKYERPVPSGKMNGVQTTFFSTLPTKKGVDISIPFCCGDTFNPDDYITTPMGKGIVSKASFSFKTGLITYTLLYQANDNLIPNTSPVAGFDTVTLYTNTDVYIDVTANDSDSDNGDSFSRVEIVTQPLHGVVAVVGLQIYYRPEASYVGSDSFIYRVHDSWGAASNNALISITVRATNTAPVANDDYYTCYTEVGSLSVSAPGPFSNDSDDNSFTLQSYDATSIHGGTITMSSTGAFTYTPASGFTGSDTFTYTIVDDNSLTDTATVHITVTTNTNPVANPDSYTTSVNTTLAASSARDLKANDTTPSGSGWTYTVTAGTVSSTNGGTVTLYANGQFQYVPPTGFTGTDYFNYTVSNGSGTAVGTVTITVVPMFYVKLTTCCSSSANYYINCSGTPSIKGSTSMRDYTVSFYSNSAGTTPYDVTGLGIVVNLRRVISGNNSDSDNNTDVTTGYSVSGTSQKILDDTPVSRNWVSCDNFYDYDKSWSYNLASGNYIII